MFILNVYPTLKGIVDTVTFIVHALLQYCKLLAGSGGGGHQCCAFCINKIDAWQVLVVVIIDVVHFFQTR